MKIHKILPQLFDQALKSTVKFKHAAAIIMGGKILAIAHNSDRTHVDGKICCGLHAEHNAIRKCKKTINSVMIVARFLKNGELSDSMPCIMCKKLIIRSGIKKIYHSVENGFVKINPNMIGTHYSRSYRHILELHNACRQYC